MKIKEATKDFEAKNNFEIWVLELSTENLVDGNKPAILEDNKFRKKKMKIASIFFLVRPRKFSMQGKWVYAKVQYGDKTMTKTFKIIIENYYLKKE